MMKDNIVSAVKERQRKMLLVLPVLVFPFVTMAFWALGGGSSKGAKDVSGETYTGINPALPDANLKDDITGKMAYYDRAAMDSSKRKSERNNDPNVEFMGSAADDAGRSDRLSNRQNNIGLLNSKTDAEANEEKVYRKLDELNAVLHSPDHKTTGSVSDHLVSMDAPGLTAPVLNAPKTFTNESVPVQDTEIKQLNGMLEKILDIQHPERIEGREKMKLQGHEKTLAISGQTIQNIVSILDTGQQESQSFAGTFLGLDASNKQMDNNAIRAVVHVSQSLVSGGVIQLRLLDDAYVDGRLLRKGSFVYGVVTLSNERLTIQVVSIRNEQSIYPVKMEVYDMDGLAGIYIPGAINRDVSMQSADNAIQSLALNSLDPSIGAQAASAGIETAKQLVSRKVKLVRVWVKSGYKILLRDVHS